MTTGGDAIVPTSVRDAVTAPVAQLSAPARDLIGFVAVVPEHVRWALLADLTGQPAHLIAGVQRGLLEVTEEGVGF